MKTLTILFTIATLLTGNAFAQTGPEYITITLTSNHVPQPACMTMKFSSGGNNVFELADTTSQPHPVIADSSNAQAGDSIIPGNNRHPLYPFTMSSDSVRIDKYDARPNLDRYTSFAFGIAAYMADTISINAHAFFGFDPSYSSANGLISGVYLEDLTTGIFHSLLGVNSSLVIPANANSAMNYRLHVIIKPAEAATAVTCSGDNNGAIMIHHPFNTNWHYKIYDNGNMIRCASVSHPDTTVTGLSSQLYSFSVYINNMLADSGNVFVASPAPVISHFTPDNNSVFTNANVLFTNGSSGASFYTWTFGDSTGSNDTDATHGYMNAGDYPVTLYAMNNNGCTSSYTDTIHVSIGPMVQGPHFSQLFSSNETAYANEEAAREVNPATVNVTGQDQKISLEQNGEGRELTVRIMNMNGQLLSTFVSADQAIQISVPATGVYLVVVTFPNGEMISRKVVVRN